MLKDILKKILPAFIISWYHFLLTLLGAVFYQFPGKKLIVIGITGTNGKSTVVAMVSKILNEGGHKTAALSSIKFQIGEEEKPNLLKQTMPGRFRLQKFLREAVDNGCKYAVLEVTSEGIKQYRHKFIDFDIAVFTNLTPEHIESHGGFDNYRKAKLQFFRGTKELHIINKDDENSKYFLKVTSIKKIIYGVKEQEAAAGSKESSEVSAENIELKPDGLSFIINGIDFNLKLLGEFNVYNALAAICVGLSQEISLKDCKLALEKIEGIPGRMEKVASLPFKVFVDYAFTPSALEKVYQTLKPGSSKMICVLGACGGGRDKWKRPVLGQIAAKYCDEIIITNEDPYDEDPMEIIDQVVAGAEGISVNPPKFYEAKFGRVNPRQSASIHKILDRRQAIREALKKARPDDVVVITGKGSEPWMCVEKGKKIPWDDRQIVREEFRRIQAN